MNDVQVKERFWGSQSPTLPLCHRGCLSLASLARGLRRATQQVSVPIPHWSPSVYSPPASRLYPVIPQIVSSQLTLLQMIYTPQGSLMSATTTWGKRRLQFPLFSFPSPFSRLLPPSPLTPQLTTEKSGEIAHPSGPRLPHSSCMLRIRSRILYTSCSM